MQAIWSDSYSEDSASTTFENARYDPNDMLSFVASIEHENNSYCDSDSDINDDEFIDEQKVKFFENIFIEHERLIKSYMKNHEILDANKNKINVLNAKNSNLLKKIIFLKSEHHSFLEKNNVPTQQIKNNKPSSFTLELKCLMKYLIKAKPMVIKDIWGISTKMKLPLVEKLCLLKVKMIPLTK